MASILVPTPVDRKICTMCGKEFEKDLILVPDADLCPDCRKAYGGMAYVFCNTCQKVVTRINPGSSESGYVVIPGQLLHVNECPQCHPGIIRSMPVEIQEYEDAKGK